MNLCMHFFMYRLCFFMATAIAMACVMYPPHGVLWLWAFGAWEACGWLMWRMPLHARDYDDRTKRRADTYRNGNEATWVDREASSNGWAPRLA